MTSSDLSERAALCESDDPTRIDLGPLPHLVGYMVRRAQLRLFQDFMETMAELKIRPAQFSVLAVVGANRGLKQAQVCAALGVKRANMVGLIDGLEADGLLRRAMISSDRRSRVLSLTKAGERTLARALDLVAEHEQRVTEPIGPDGRRELLELLRRIAEPHPG